MRLRCQLCPSTDSLRFWQLTQSTLTLNPLPRRADRGRQNGFAAMIRPRLSVIAMKIGSGNPVVGATLVVARSRHQPGFIPSERSEESKVHNRKTGQPGPLSHQWRVADSQIRTPFSRSWESACPVLNPAVGARVNTYSCQPPPGERYREGVFAIQLTKTEQLPLPLTFESQEPLSYTTHVGTRHQAPSARHVKRHKTL